jgi:hypothetical protein
MGNSMVRLHTVPSRDIWVASEWLVVEPGPSMPGTSRIDLVGLHFVMGFCEPEILQGTPSILPLQPLPSPDFLALASVRMFAGQSVIMPGNVTGMT